MKYLVECDEPHNVETGEHLTVGTFDNFTAAVIAQRYAETSTRKPWTIWRIEFHYEGRAEGDRS